MNYDDEVSNNGRRNLEKLLSCFMNAMYIFQYPENSIYSYQYEHERLRGATPDPIVFNNILEKHFNMSTTLFFNGDEIDDSIFNAFENDCFNETMMLCDIQVGIIYEHLMSVEYALFYSKSKCQPSCCSA